MGIGIESAESIIQIKNNLIKDQNFINNPKILGLKLIQQEWVTIHRIQTGHGQTGKLLAKWKMRDSPICDCGHLIQIYLDQLEFHTNN